MNYTSHNNNLFYNYGLANVLYYMRNIKNKNIKFEDLTFSNILEAAKYFYEKFTTIKSNPGSKTISNKEGIIRFKYGKVEPKQKDESGKIIKLGNIYMPANLIYEDKAEKDLIRIGESIINKSISEEDVVPLTKSCFPLAGKYLFANYTTQKNTSITSSEFLCYFITTITPLKPSFILIEKDPQTKQPSFNRTAIIPDFSKEDMYEWIRCFSYSFNSFYNSNNIDYKSKNGKSINPTINGNYYCSGKFKSTFLRELYLLSDLYEILKNNEIELSKLYDLLLDKNKKNVVFYTFNRKTCYVHKYSHHIVNLSKQEILKPALDSFSGCFLRYYLDKNNLLQVDDWDIFNLSKEIFERDVYNFLLRLDDDSLRKLNSKRITFQKETESIFKYYYKTIKNMKKEEIESASEIAGSIRTRYRAMLYSEFKKQIQNENELHKKVDSELSKYIDEFASYADKRVSPTDFVKMFHRFCRDSKTATFSIKNMSFINSVLENKIELQDAKNILISMLRISSVKKSEKTAEEGEEDAILSPLTK